MSHGFFTSYPDKGLKRAVGQIAGPAKGGTDLYTSHLADRKAAGASTNPEDAEAIQKFIKQEGPPPSPTK